MGNQKEPDPTTGIEDVASAVIKDMQERAEMGARKYGQRLMTFDGRRSKVDAYQEALDLAMYLKKEIMEEDYNNMVLNSPEYFSTSTYD